MREFQIYLILAIILVSCESTNSPSQEAVYPSDYGMPPTIKTVFPKVIPTPSASTGSVWGKLVSSETNQPAAGFLLYLANPLPLTPGPDYLINIDPVNSPRTQVFDDGQFLFENVTPGRYILVLWTPHDSSYVFAFSEPDQGLVVNIDPGEIVDVGTVGVSIPK